MAELNNTRRQFLRRMSAAGLGGSLAVPLLTREADAHVAPPSRLPGALGPVEVVTFDPEYVICMRHSGPYDGVSETWRRLSSYAMENGIAGHATRAIGLTYGDPTRAPTDELYYDACLTLDRDHLSSWISRFESRSGVRLETIGSGTNATILYRGPHSEIGRAYDVLLDAAAQLAGVHSDLIGPPFYEIYLNDPRTTPSQELLTEVHVPLPTP